MQPLRVRNRQRRCAEVFGEQSAHVPAGHAEPFCKMLDVTVIQRATRYQA